MVHRAKQTAATFVGPSPVHCSMAEIITCMRVAATMLQLADDKWPTLQKHNRGQAELLNAAANDLEAQHEGK